MGSSCSKKDENVEPAKRNNKGPKTLESGLGRSGRVESDGTNNEMNKSAQSV